MASSLVSTSFYGWQGFELSSDRLQCGITPDIGGRIISLKFDGEELFFVNEKYLGETFDVDTILDWKAKKLELGHRLWGGDKTWVAPESKWIYLLPPFELDAGKYGIKNGDDFVEMTSPVDRETGLKIIRRVELCSENEIILKQTFVNNGDRSIECAIWNVTQLLRPMEIYFLADEQLVQPDKRFDAAIQRRHEFVHWRDPYVMILCERPVQFKFGGPVQSGEVLSLKRRQKDCIAMLRQFEIEKHSVYPQHNMVEVYNTSDYNYCECEILSPLVMLKPDHKMYHEQCWRFGRFSNQDSIDFIFRKLSGNS